MRILYDGYIYGLQKSGGINRYFYEIISRLPECSLPVIYGSRPAHEGFSKRQKIKCLPRMHDILRPVAELATHYFDLIHPTYYELTPPLSYSGLRTRCVVTVHDFIIARYEKRFLKGQKVLAAQDQAIKRADAIICVSESTRSDLLERYPECENRCSVTHLASSMARGGNRSLIPQSNICKPYCLYVGSRTFYKNFNWCLDAVAELKRRGLDMNLVVVGSPWTVEEQAEVRNSGLGERVKLIDFPTDETLAALYRDAVALLYPSEYEGFGLPPLEAMAMGCPVIAQRASSIPEVVGNGGILMQVEEASPLLIADLLAVLLSDSTLRATLSVKAQAQASTFSWERTTEQTFNIYQTTLGR
jgi:glycosyltransferase involved in cell wall biosynthesis